MGSRALSEYQAKEGKGKKKMKKARVKTGKRKFGESESDLRLAAARSKGRKKQRGGGKGRWSGGGGGTGPRLPFGIKRELASLARTRGDDASDSGDESTENQHPGGSVYEYDEPLPQEEAKKNRRFDPVENFEFELPEDFQDEEIDEELASVGGSDEDGDFGSFGEDLRRSSTFRKRRSEENNDVRGEDEGEYDGEGEEQIDEAEEVNDDDDDPERHSRLLQEITGLPRDAFERNIEKALSSKTNLELEEASGLNEAKSDGTISVQDLLDPLYGKPGYSSLRKRMRHLERKSEPVRAPLPKVIQEKLDRTAAYKLSKDDITKWEPVVKKNREAPTIYFGGEVQARIPSVGEIASQFKPRTGLEQKISSILGNAKVVEAHMKDGAMLLELNKISVESVRERQNRLAKMRSLLFRHEMKAKHIKKIKSKTYHRILKKNKSKSIDVETDPEAAKEHAMKQEFKRAEERMTLKHKNSSKWARRILERGLNAQDEGTRIAISEQLNQHALLTRKMDSMKDNSSSDSSTDEEDEEEVSASDDKQASKLLESAKNKTIKIIEEEQEIPKSGLLSMPFMVRGMEKKKEAASEEARRALDDYDLSLDPTNGSNGTITKKKGASSGRMVFGDAKKEIPTSMSRVKQREFSQELNSEDDEGDFGSLGNDNACPDETKASGNIEIDPTSLLEDLGIHHDPVLKSTDELKTGSGPRTTFEVSICAPQSLIQRNDNMTQGCDDFKVHEMQEQNCHQNQEAEQLACSDGADETEEDNQSVESMSDYELPSMPELIQRAFASDDVEDEFEKEKLETLNEEVPMPEKPMSLPGWGQWTDVQQKKGLPSWILEEHEIAKRNRENALKLRKDADLKHVIISEKTNKKAEKFYTPTLPFPHKYEEVFEQSMRVPLGPDFNPAKSFRELNRPSVIKTPGVLINPIQFKEVNPLDSKSESNTGNENRKPSKMKGAKKKTVRR